MAKTYIVKGMSCNGCARAVETAIKEVFPVAQVQVDLKGKRVTIDGINDDDMVQKAVEKAGYSYAGPV